MLSVLRRKAANYALGRSPGSEAAAVGDTPRVASPSLAGPPIGSDVGQVVSKRPASLTVAEPRRTCTGLPRYARRGHPRHRRRYHAAATAAMASSAARTPVTAISRRARTRSPRLDAGGSSGRPIHTSVTSVPRSQIGPTSRRRSAPAAAASLQPEFGPGRTACCRSPTRSASTPRAAGDDERRDRQQQPGEPRRHVVHHVVEPRAGPAETQVARRAVADHRVERRRDLEQHEAGDAADGVPADGAGDAVGQALGQALDGGAAAGGGIEPIGVADDQRADRGARAVEIAAAPAPARRARRGAADRRARAGCRR